MGRKIRRVPLDFDYPLKKVWHGFKNPYPSDPCPCCGRSGYSPEAKLLRDQWYGDAEFHPSMTGSQPFLPESEALRLRATINLTGARIALPFEISAIRQEATRLADYFNRSWNHHLDQDDVNALVEGGRLKDLTHDFIPGRGWVSKPDFSTPTAEQVNLWSLYGFGHDSINEWICTKAKLIRLGLDPCCSHCGGSGEMYESEEIKRLSEEWEPVDPPEGEGWQLWETVTEGSPISPVFATEDEFVNWLYDAGEVDSLKAVAEFLSSGVAPSGVLTSSGFKANINALEVLSEVRDEV